MISKTAAKQFAREYVNEGFIGRRAAHKINPELTDGSARQKAIHLLKSPVVQLALKELLQDNGLSNEDIRKLLARNASQAKSISASNQALDIAIRVKGEYSPDRKETFNLNIDVDNPSELLDKIKALKEELSELEDEMNTTPKEKDRDASPVEASKSESNSRVPPKPLQALTGAQQPLKNTTPTHKQV